MLAIEGQILAVLDPLSKSLKDHPASTALLARMRAAAEDHIEGLKVRMLGIGVDIRPPSVSTGFATVVPLGSEKPLSPTSALQLLGSLVQHAAFGYSVLHVVAHRQCDSGWGVESGSTADLAEEHLREYSQVLHHLNLLVSDVTVWELSRDGLPCRCVCPSCGLGICMCGTHGTATMVDAMRPPILPETVGREVEISLMSPARPDSVADHAGLERGDTILRADEQPVGTKSDLNVNIADYMGVIQGHRPGEMMRLQVRRPTGQVEEVRVPKFEAKPSPEERRLAAIMFTDMVGYTALAQKDEARALELLEEHRALVRATFPQHKGREIKTMGDGFLIEFASALDAATCAIEIQRAVRKRNQERSQDRIQLRIGVHVGDLVSIGGDIFGDAVNIAARIEPMAEAGGICISQQVYDQVWNKVPAKMDELAECHLKNVSAPVNVYRIRLPK